MKDDNKAAHIAAKESINSLLAGAGMKRLVDSTHCIKGV